MSKLVAIVEGEGEIKAAPALLRRILYEHFEEYRFQNIETICAKGNKNLTKEGGLERFLELTRRKPDCRGMLILLDAEEKARCVFDVAGKLAERTRMLNLPFPVVVVCARCEYELWFLASWHTLAGQFALPADVTFEGNPEEKCNAKEWLTRQMPNGKIYKETIDQVTMTGELDIPHLIKNVRSFQRLVHAVEELITAIDKKENIVTPLPGA